VVNKPICGGLPDEASNLPPSCMRAFARPGKFPGTGPRSRSGTADPVDILANEISGSFALIGPAEYDRAGMAIQRWERVAKPRTALILISSLCRAAATHCRPGRAVEVSWCRRCTGSTAFSGLQTSL